jgi:hypothetical protein
MLSERTTGAAAHDLLAAAAVEHSERGGDLAALPGELECLGCALRAAGRAYEEFASRVAPAAQPLDRGNGSRYQRAAATWPVSPPPSHERFAAALASLHEAADAARMAARRCDQARQAVDVLLRTSTRS